MSCAAFLRTLFGRCREASCATLHRVSCGVASAHARRVSRRGGRSDGRAPGRTGGQVVGEAVGRAPAVAQLLEDLPHVGATVDEPDVHLLSEPGRRGADLGAHWARD